MKYVCTVISVADISAARKFYEELFGLEVYQDYGRNIVLWITAARVFKKSKERMISFGG